MKRRLLLIALAFVMLCMAIPVEAKGNNKEEKSDQKKEKKKKKKHKVKTKKRYKVIYTAYYEDDSPMEGGYLDALGYPLDHEDKTIAVPKCIDLKTKWKIIGTDTWRDGEVFTARDRGGRIKELDDGTLKVDILVDSAETADAFGVREGYIEEA